MSQSGNSESRQPSAGSRAVFCAVAIALVLALGAAKADAQEAWLASAIDILDQRAPPVLSINDAAGRAQDRFGGQVISISPAEQDGRRGYRVKILLENGRVKTLFVESRTGTVIDRREHER